MKDESPSASQRSFTLKFMGVVAVINIVLVVTGRESDDTLRFMLASLILWVSAFPLWHYFATAQKDIPYVPAMTITYFMYYALPAFNRVLRELVP